MTDLWEPNEDEQPISTREGLRRLSVNLMPSTVLLLLFNVAVFVYSPIVSRVFAVAFLLIVPGTILMSLTSVRPRETSVRLSLSVGASALFLMLVGLIYSVVLPHLGVARPLSRFPLVIGIDISTVIGVAVQVPRREPFTYLLAGHTINKGQLGLTGILALLPIGAVAGAERLSNGHGGAVALIVLVIIGIVLCALVVYAERVPLWSIGVVLYSASSAVLLMTSMRSNYPMGFDIQSEYAVLNQTLHSGVWHLPSNGNPYASMLSITILPAVLSLVTHVSGIYLFKLVYPLIFSLFPVMVYVASVRWFTARAALIGAIVLIVQGYYSADMTGLARQEIGLLYFALLVVVAFDASIRRRPRQVLSIVAGLGMAVSHYSTAYFACTILILGFLAQLLFRGSRQLRSRWEILLTSPVVLVIVGVVLLWNVVITRSAQNVFDLAASVQAHGFQFLPSSSGSSLISRFLNSDVTSTVSATKISSIAASYYHTHAAFIHPYPASITNLFPVEPSSVPVIHRSVSMSHSNLVNNIASGLSELLLLVIGVGIIVFLWRERKSARGGRAEFGFIALGCIVLLAILRLSGTVSALYNAPRGQVQGMPFLSIGLAAVCAWLFTGRSVKRVASIGLATLVLGLLFFNDSGLSSEALGGGAPDTLVNYGDVFDSYYFTTADIASANWLAQHDAKGQVVYADDYGTIQLYEVGKLNGIVSTVIPSVLEPGALVYVDSTNDVGQTAFASINGNNAVYQFPISFLNSVKNVVYSTGTTAVYG